eukprot:6180839-Pleurochrysis_carterae.AAC.2
MLEHTTQSARKLALRKLQITPPHCKIATPYTCVILLPPYESKEPQDMKCSHKCPMDRSQCSVHQTAATYAI